MEKKTWEERRKKKIVPQKEQEPEKKDYRRWAKYIIATAFIILLFIFLRDKEEQGTGSRDQGLEKTGDSVLVTPVPRTLTPVVPVPTPEPQPLSPVVKNTPPEIVSIKLTPKVVYPGTKIKTEVSGRDADEGDEVNYFYEWRKNNAALPDNTQPEIDTTGFKKGELITLFVTPFDGKDKGKTRFSRAIVIANRPPEITSLPPVSLSNGKYIYEVKANDHDGDVLTYSLENAPSGMTIDPATGVISWDIPSATDLKSVSTYDIRIIVSDGDAAAFQGFSMTPEIEIK